MARTFLDFNPCTNYGGQNLLSASGTGCSSEAVGQLSGMSGLLYSVAQQYGPADLTAAEAMQIWFHTVDDIDIPESRLEGDDRRYYWSQPGFDQRFGYGRVNANTAVEALIAGRVPPEVDVVRPYWFEVLYRDQLDGPVAIEGHISAKRATSYDYVVEWAPGVQPEDSAFEEIASQQNVPSDVVTGGDEPIALFDVRNIDTEHEPDPDSKFGENKYTITVRVRALAHYGGEIGDVPGEMRRTYAVYADDTLVKGFPIYVGASGEANPKMADIDADGTLDLIYPTSNGHILVYKLTSDGPELLLRLRGRAPRRFARDTGAGQAELPGSQGIHRRSGHGEGAGRSSRGERHLLGDAGDRRRRQRRAARDRRHVVFGVHSSHQPRRNAPGWLSHPPARDPLV